MKYENTIKEVQEMVEALEAITDVINNNHLLDCEKVHTIKVILGQEEEEETPEINYAVFPIPDDVDVADGFYAHFTTIDEDILSLLLNTEFDIEEK